MSDDFYEQTTTSSGRIKGPLSIDPLHFSAALFLMLILFVLYLLLPRGFRVHYFRGYPKRYAWSARSRASRVRRPNGFSSVNSQVSSTLYWSGTEEHSNLLLAVSNPNSLFFK